MSQTPQGETGGETQPLTSKESRARSKFIGHYVLGRTIGEGTFGKVKLGTHVLTGQRVAVKVLEKERIVEIADVERVAREVHILKLIRHPHIVQLYEIIETKRQLYLIMEYAAGGELFDYIVSMGKVQEPEACRLFHQIISGIEKIHDMNIVHRDLKPENLLLDHNSSIKIVDFGLSNVFREGQLLRTACGSPCYAPPEMISGNPYLPRGCDIWSAGVILFAIVCGYLPFEDPSTAELYRTILSGEYLCPDFLSEPVKDLIGRLLTTEPAQRFTVKDIRAHPWYRQIPEASLPVQWLPGTREPEEDLLNELEGFGFPRDYAIRCLEFNKHNHVTTTFYLLAERRRRTQGSDVGSAPVANSLGGTDPFSLIGLEGIDSGKAAPVGALLQAYEKPSKEGQLGASLGTSATVAPAGPSASVPPAGVTTPPASTGPNFGQRTSRAQSPRVETPELRATHQQRGSNPSAEVGRGYGNSLVVGAARSPATSPVQVHVSASSPRRWPSPCAAAAYPADVARRLPAGAMPAWPSHASQAHTPAAGHSSVPMVSDPPRVWSPISGAGHRVSSHGARRQSHFGFDAAHQAGSPERNFRSATPRGPASPSPRSASPRDRSPVVARTSPAERPRSLAAPPANVAYHGKPSAPLSTTAALSGGSGQLGRQGPQPKGAQQASLMGSLLAASPRFAAGSCQAPRSRGSEPSVPMPHTPRNDFMPAGFQMPGLFADAAQGHSRPSAPLLSGGASVSKVAGSAWQGCLAAPGGRTFSLSPRGSRIHESSVRASSNGAPARGAAAAGPWPMPGRPSQAATLGR